MKESFFGRFKKNFGKDYGGRYYATVLAECINSEPKLLETIFKKQFNQNIVAVVEWSIPGGSKNRRADIAIINNSTKDLFGLIEVKYEDELSPGVDLQLDDYLKISKNEEIPFTYLTVYSPKVEHLEKIKRSGGRHLYFSDIYYEIGRKKFKNIAVITLLKEFIREEMPVFEESIDEKSIQLLLVKGLGITNKNGLSKVNTSLRMREDVPDLIRILLNNVLVLGEDLRSILDPNRLIFKRAPLTSFTFNPNFDFKAIERNLKKAEGNEDDFEMPRPDGGSLLVWSQLYFTKEKNSKLPWMYLSIGYHISISATEKPAKIEKSLYVSLETTKNRYFESLRKIKTVRINKDRAVEYVGSCWENVYQQAISSPDIPADLKKTIRELA